MQNPSLFGLGLHPTRSVRAQLHAGVVRRAHKGLRQTKVQAAAPRTGRSGGARSPVLGALAGLVLSTALSACGTPGQDGDCGPFLSSAECQVVRVQLGLLDRRRPAGRWTTLRVAVGAPAAGDERGAAGLPPAAATGLPAAQPAGLAQQ